MLDQDRLIDTIFSAVPEAVLVTDSSRTIRRVNESFTEIFQLEPEDVVGKTTEMLFAVPGDYEAYGRIFGSDPPCRRGRSYYLRARRKDDSVFPCKITVTQIRDERGAVSGSFKLVQDLSEIGQSALDQIDAHERAGAEQAFIESLYRRTPAIMHSIDAEGALCMVSDAWLERFGYAEDEVIGRRSTEFLTEESRRHAVEEVLPMFWREGQIDRIPYTFLTKAGEPVEIEMSAIIDVSSGQSRTLALLEDVTERNRASRALEERNRDLQDFAHIAAHDLQTPLRQIAMFSQFAEEELAADNPDGARRELENLRDCAVRLNGMVRALLDFTLSGSVRPTDAPTDMAVLLDGAVEQHREAIDGTGAQVRIGAMPALTCDPALMQQAFANLIGNALKFVAANVTPEIDITAETTETGVRITVTDNGIGVPDMFRERIFQPLQRLHTRDSGYAGHGIGLSLTRRIIKAHEGDIRVADTEGAGTRFVVSLPRHILAAQPTSERRDAKIAGC